MATSGELSDRCLLLRMLSSPLQRKKIFIGTFVHNTSLQEISVLENHAVGVDEKGVIAFVEEAREGLAGLRKRHGDKGWDEDGVDVVVAGGLGGSDKGVDEVGFWFPGFVGEFFLCYLGDLRLDECLLCF